MHQFDKSTDAAPLATLVCRAERGDQWAWQEIVRRYAHLVWAVARSHRLTDADAADVTQATWLTLSEQLPSLREPESLPGWLCTTARRESLRVLKVRRREEPTGLYGQEPTSVHGADPEAHVVRSDTFARMWRAFAELPERCQRLLRVLVFAPERSYAQVSEALGMPVGSIGPRRSRCLESLRRGMATAGVPEEVA